MINTSLKWTILVLLCTVLSVVQARLSMAEKLAALRKQTQERGISAYIIPSEDEHQSEYVSAYDRRRVWITDFTGSSGVAVVTANKAALWVDSRYFIQAAEQLDTNYWILMKTGESGVPSIEAWLAQELTANPQVVAASAKFVSISSWQNRERILKQSGIEFKNSETDLIDLIWPADERPPKPSGTIEIHSLEFAGRTWADKIREVKEKLKAASADFFVVTALDEVAWLFNLRGQDIPYNPMFFGYAIIDANTDSHRLFIDTARITDDLRKYLKDGNAEIILEEYQTVFSEVKQEADNNRKIWISPLSSYAVYNSVSNKENLINKNSPIRSIKARKTETEIKNIRTCQIRDSAARIRHMFWLETEIKAGRVVTEMTSAAKLTEFQAEGANYKSPSFGSISAVGAHAASPHYSTSEGDNATLTTKQVYLLDAGAQYLDCSTDITRTHHFGSPKPIEVMAYTKVMQGAIDLISLVFPAGIYGGNIDVLARRALWQVELDYGHGTGHGIGYFLSIHESPASISMNSRRETDEALDVGMVESDEPGYYLEGDFGIRLETDMVVVPHVSNKMRANDKQYFEFETLTLVPFEKNLIDKCLLTDAQVDYLNKYNMDIRNKVSGHMKTSAERDYLLSKTEPFNYAYTYQDCRKKPFNTSSRLKTNIFSFLFVVGLLVCLNA